MIVSVAGLARPTAAITNGIVRHVLIIGMALWNRFGVDALSRAIESDANLQDAQGQRKRILGFVRRFGCEFDKMRCLEVMEKFDTENFIDEVMERNENSMSIYTTEVMRLFCIEAKLEEIFKFFEEKKNVGVNPRDKNFNLPGVNGRYLRYAIENSVANLVIFSQNVVEEDQYHEITVQIDCAMQRMGLSPDDRLRLFLKAERTIR